MTREPLLSSAAPVIIAAKGRGRRFIFILGVIITSVVLYFCSAIFPLTYETDYHRNVAIVGNDGLSRRSIDPKITEEIAQNHVFNETYNVETKKHAGFTVETSGCRIPDLPARNSFINKYIKEKEPNPKCDMQWSPLNGKLKQRGPPLVESNLTSLWIVESALPHYNVSDLNQLSCCYRSFWRIKEDSEKYSIKADNHYKMSVKCIPFAGRTAVVEEENEEYVRVECSVLLENSTDFNTTSSPAESYKPALRQIYRDFHAFIPIKRRVEERCMQTPHQADEVSILVFGIDAVSRLNMERELPMLQRVLTEPPLNGIPLLGYNKVGDNTFPNLVPLLTGMTEEQMGLACPWPSARHKLDPCPFIWKSFAKRGYRTAYGEDCTWMSSFNYAKTGFVDSPADYYARPFLQAAENEQGHSKRWNVKLCVGPRLALSNILSYIHKFSHRFANERNFGFYWTNSVSHDFLNMPHNGDALYAQLLLDLTKKSALNRTVIIVLSDHGIRWGGIRETYQGRLEERLPFSFIAFPEWFRDRFPTAIANVRRNARNRLTTPFDLYETMYDLLEPSKNLNPERIRERSLHINKQFNSSKFNENKYRGISLFIPIPPSRTCKKAHIPPHFCTCQESSQVLVTERVVQRSVLFLINNLNSRLKKYHQCAKLRLNSIHSAQRNVPLEEAEVNENTSIVDYVIVFETQPGNAIFEATVRETPSISNSPNASTILQLAGIISRINRYGDQSRCVSDFHMKLYCFCT